MARGLRARLRALERLLLLDTDEGCPHLPPTVFIPDWNVPKGKCLNPPEPIACDICGRLPVEIVVRWVHDWRAGSD